MIMPLAQLIMAQVAGPQRMGRVMGVVSMPAMLAPILGPVVGGLILQNLHWSWIFFVNAPIGVVAIVPRLADAPADRLGRGRAARQARPGAAAHGRRARRSSASPSSARHAPARLRARCSAARSPGSSLSVAFCLHALRIERPLLDIRLYANKVFAGASFTTFGLGAALFGAMILVPLYYQEVRHLSVIDTGLLDRPAGASAR